MSPLFDQVFQAAMELPETERVHLVDSLIASFKLNNQSFDDSWMREIERRTAVKDLIDEGKVEMIPWEVVRAELRAKGSGRD